MLDCFGDAYTDDDLLHYIARTDAGTLEKKLVETSVEELRTATEQTYTPQKKILLQQLSAHTFKGKTKADYLARLEYELKVIYEMGYNTYFLVVRDYIHRARSAQIMVGPGRWSVAGSLLSFFLAITDLDPLEYDLIFERFLNPWRISMPDIDTDFEDTFREKVIEYIKQRYGNEKVAHIGTAMSLAARAAFKDVARVMGIKYDQANKLSTLVSEKTIALSVEKNKELQDAMKADTRLEKVVQIATSLEWTVRQTGVHACGMIIAPAPVVYFSAIQYPPKAWSKELRDESRIVSQYEWPIVENLGLLKMDILGLRNLSIIKHTAKIVHARCKRTWEVMPEMLQKSLKTMRFHPPLDDPKAYSIFAAGDTSGVFQFESDGMRTWLKKLKPNRFDDLIAMVALYRPGPMEFIPHYIDRKYGIQQISYMSSELEQVLIQHYGDTVAQEEKRKLIEDLAPFMDTTYGIAVYQEQLMRLVQAMAWFSMPEADNLRKWVGKKIREVIEKIKIEFIKRAASYKDYKTETATWVYEKMIEPAADYSFNKSHAACYAYISYQTAWLKAHYPLEFHAALLRSVEQEPEKLAWFIQEVQLQGIVITPPKINSSFEHVAAIDDHLEIGFLWIKWIGSEVAEQIEQERNTNGMFSSLSDFLRRCSWVINKKTLESLLKAWSLDEYGERSILLQAIPEMIERSKQQNQWWWWLFGWGFFDTQEFIVPSRSASKDHFFNLRSEKEVFNIPISSHPLDGLYPRCRAKYNFINTVNVENYGDFRLLCVVLSINKWMRGWYFLKVEDISGQMEFYFQDKIDLEPFSIVSITGYKGMRFPKADMISVLSWKQLIQKATTASLYDPERTVAKARVARKWTQVLEVPVSTDRWLESLAHNDAHEVTSLIEEEDMSGAIGEIDWWPSLGTWHIYAMPDNVEYLQKIAAIVKQYPGDKKIQVGTMQLELSEEWQKEMQLLLW